MIEDYYTVSVPTAKRVRDVYPEARKALEELIPELRKQTKTAVATDAFFSEWLGSDCRLFGHSKECLLTKKFLLGHKFTKITFEWEE